MSEEKKKPAKKEKDPVHTNFGHKRIIFWIGVGLTFAVIFMWVLGAFDVLELKSVDWRFKARGERPTVAPVAIVAIDDDSLNGWVDEKNDYQTMPDRWTWPRTFYGTVIDNLREAGATMIAFDLAYSESSKRDRDQDSAFALAAHSHGRVIFGERDVRKGHGGWKKETLIPPLAKASRDVGHVNALPDRDSYLRGFMPLWPDSSNSLNPGNPNLDLAVLRQFVFENSIKPSFDEEEMTIRLGDLNIPLGMSRQVRINFAGPPKSFPTYSFHDVFFKTMDMSVFKGKIIYVGSSSEILHDNHATPFGGSVNKMPGVEIHAHMLDTMLSEEFLKEVSGFFEIFLILAMGLLTSFATFRVKAWQGFIVALIEISVYSIACFVAFQLDNLIVPMVAPIVSIGVAFAGIAVYKGVVEERRAKTTRQMFSRYVSKSIVDEILKNPNKVSLGGEEKEVTILFSDIRGFTNMSERLSAPEVVEVLNDYLTHMVDVVIGNNGTLDKYVGDAIMAVWGSPLYDPDHKLNAARSCVQMMEVLQELQVKWAKEGKPHIDIGIGLNSGVVVAGNMGHPDFKMDYTVIGDDVNLAARMESANKAMRSHILITGSTFEGCKDLVDVVKHEPIMVKGKAKPVDVYEIIGWKGQGRAAWAKPLPL